MSDLEKRTLVELRKMAKELGIPAISGLKKRELIEKIEQSSEVQKNDSVPRSAASDFSHRNFDEKTEAPQDSSPYLAWLLTRSAALSKMSAVKA